MKILLIILLSSCSLIKLKFNKDKTDVAKVDNLDKELADKFKVKAPVETKVIKQQVQVEEKKLNETSKKAINLKKAKKTKVSVVKTTTTTITTTTSSTTTTLLLPTSSFPHQTSEANSYNIWKLFNSAYLFPTEEHNMKITYMGISAASVLIKMRKSQVKVGGKNAYAFYARAKSAPFYKWVYELDDIVESFVDINHFVPLKYSLVQRESKKDIDHIELFDRDKKMTHFRYKRVKEGKTTHKKKDVKMPYYSQDFLSVFYFFRGLPLNIGDSYIIPITVKAKTYKMLVKVIGTEKISVGKFRNMNALKLSVQNKYSGELSKKGDMTFWLSHDKYRRLLQAKADTKIGNVYGKLNTYKVDGVSINN